MRKWLGPICLLGIWFAWGGLFNVVTATPLIPLPEPLLQGNHTLEELLRRRRSVREYTPQPLSLGEVSQLLWAAQGVTDARGLRTAPSAGALYPLELYLVAGAVKGLRAGVYRYRFEEHNLQRIGPSDRRLALAAAALDQRPVAEAAAVLVFSAVYERTTGKYGQRGVRYAHMEVGHAAQNALLQALSLGLGAVVIGAFGDQAVREVLQLSESEHPLYLMPVGRPRNP